MAEIHGIYLDGLIIKGMSVVVRALATIIAAEALQQD
jgi:hypothetical protein